VWERIRASFYAKATAYEVRRFITASKAGTSSRTPNYALSHIVPSGTLHAAKPHFMCVAHFICSNAASFISTQAVRPLWVGRSAP